MRSLLHAPRTRRRSIAAATFGALALVGSLLVATPAQAINDTGTGGVFVPASGRVLDTKVGTGGFSTPMEAGKYRTIKIAGVGGIPDDGTVGAVSLNATVSGSADNGTLFGRPDANTSRTTMLIYNANAGEYVSNTAIVAVSAAGTIQVSTETAARLILDVQGYYTANTDGTAAGGFVSVAGKRIVDTRSGLGAPKALLAPGKTVDIQVAGTNGVPADASGAVVNLLPINTTASDGFLTPYATGAARPDNALHYAPSVNTSIQAQVRLSSGGKMTIYNGSSTISLVIDLQGYFTAAGTAGATFTPGVGRVFDSRAAANTILAKNETRAIPVAGQAGIPVMGSGISAVVLTLTAVHGGSAGRASVWANGTAQPDTTSLNFQTDEIRTNTVTVALGANGKINLNNVADATNYVIDVQGWYSSQLSPRITCAAPYSAGTWVKAVPADDISCNAVIPAADASGRTFSVLVDDDEVESGTQAATASNIPVDVSAFGGTHAIVATIDGGGTPLRTAYEFTLGSWADDSWSPTPPTEAQVSLAPELGAVPESEDFPDDATATFTVNGPDGAVVATSGDTGTQWTIPEGLLADGTTYTWRMTVTGENELGTTTETRTSADWKFTASNALTGSEDTSVDSTDQQCIADRTAVNAEQGGTQTRDDIVNGCSMTTTTTVSEEEEVDADSTTPLAVSRAAARKIHTKEFYQSSHAWDWHWKEGHAGRMYWDGKNAWVGKKHRGKTGYHHCGVNRSTIQATIDPSECDEYKYGAGVAEGERFVVTNYVMGVLVSQGTKGHSMGMAKNGKITYRQYYR
ncbi:hypothetical protein [Curtobacterium sp. MCBA15_007]|uniref:hypothetical protein n=1 Tax=Curtobacterium sp. MCBA15_007 TaxID=1898735 RepID=UPI000AFD373B|nr:hypothetical protein [Curtobacterium sp. MCBA15_007]